jgi:hypothetical protein
VKRNVGSAISNINNLMDDKETILKMSMKELNNYSADRHWSAIHGSRCPELLFPV